MSNKSVPMESLIHHLLVRVAGTANAGATVAVAGAATGKLDRAWGADLVPANTSVKRRGHALPFTLTHRLLSADWPAWHASCGWSIPGRSTT